MAMDETALSSAAGDWLDDLTSTVSELGTASTTTATPAPSPASASSPPAANASAPAATPAATPESASQTPGTDDATASPPNPDDTPSPTPAVAAEPFAFKADGREIALEGLTRTPDGVVQFTPDAWKAFHANHVADRGGIQQRMQSYQQQLAQARSQVATQQQSRTASEAKSDAILSQLTDWHGKGPEEFVARVAAMYDQFPTLLAKAEAEHWKQQAQMASQSQAPQQQAQAWEAAAPTFWPAFREMLDQTLADPKFAVLKDRADEVFAQLQQIGTEEQAVGFQPDGTPAFDEKTFWRELRRMAQVEQRIQQERTKAEQKADLQKRNAAALAKPNTPPVVSATPAVPASGAKGKPLSRAELQQKSRADLESDEAFARSLME